MIAHAGGIDEILIAGLFLFILFAIRRGSGGSEPPRPTGPEPCHYCGRWPAEETRRCPGCGFRRPKPRAVVEATG